MRGENRSRTALDGSNVPGNPLRSYRMSMLAHGFVDDDGGKGFDFDESDPITYAVMRRGGPVPIVAAVVLVIVVLLVLGAALLFG